MGNIFNVNEISAEIYVVFLNCKYLRSYCILMVDVFFVVMVNAVVCRLSDLN